MNVILYVFGFAIYIISLIFSFNIGIETVFCTLGAALGAMLFTVAQFKQ